MVIGISFHLHNQTHKNGSIPFHSINQTTNLNHSILTGFHSIPHHSATNFIICYPFCLVCCWALECPKTVFGHCFHAFVVMYYLLVLFYSVFCLPPLINLSCELLHLEKGIPLSPKLWQKFISNPQTLNLFQLQPWTFEIVHFSPSWLKFWVTLTPCDTWRHRQLGWWYCYQRCGSFKFGDGWVLGKFGQVGQRKARLSVVVASSSHY